MTDFDRSTMRAFTPDEIETVDGLWRALPEDHVWTGWAASGDAPLEIWIFRTRAHWRRFPLLKQAENYALLDERDRVVVTSSTLAGLLRSVEAIPGLENAYEAGSAP